MWNIRLLLFRIKHMQVTEERKVDPKEPLRAPRRPRQRSLVSTVYTFPPLHPPSPAGVPLGLFFHTHVHREIESRDKMSAIQNISVSCLWM